MIINQIEIVFTDLDGTLRDQNLGYSEVDLVALEFLGNMGITRVIATGRSMFSVNKVVPLDFPVDYVMFSTGAGIMDWQKQEYIFENHMDREVVSIVTDFLIKNDIDFMVHRPVPENHHFLYHKATKSNSDFEQRIELYGEYAHPLNGTHPEFGEACQFLAVFKKHDEYFEEIATKLKNLTDQIKIIRTTSPLDGKSVWMEIFPWFVSKGHAAEWLCNHLNINRNKSIGVGNDYNDLDLLAFTHHSFCVEGSPDELKNMFMLTASQLNHGFAEAVKKFM